MTIQKYRAVFRRNLFLPRNIIREEIQKLDAVIKDFISQGESPESILRRLGSPRELAARVQATHPEYRKSPFRFLFLQLAATGFLGVLATVLSLLFFGHILLNGIPQFFLTVSSNASLGMIGGADGPTAVYITGSFPSFGEMLLLFLALFFLGTWLYFVFRHLKKR